MRRTASGRCNGNKDADTAAPLTLNPQNGTTQSNRDLEDPQRAGNAEGEATGASCHLNMRKFVKLLGYAILGVVAAVVIAALGVLTLPVSVALLLVFIITYSVISVAPFTKRKKDEENYKEFFYRLTLSAVTVALVLLLSIIVLFVVFRAHSSLKHRLIAGIEIWKWLEIALVSCVFCNIWIGGRFVLTHVQREYDYKENLVYFTDKLRRAINCICFIVGELLVLEVAPTSKKSIIIFGLALWKWVLVLVSLFCGWYLIRISTHLLVLSLEIWQNNIWKRRYDVKRRELDEKNISEKKKRGEKLSEEKEAEKKSTKRYTIKKYAVFMAKGLRTRINILLFFLLIVLTYRFYVRPRLQLENEPEDVKEAITFIIRTFLSLLIVAVLSLIKKFLLLLWEARELYKRFSERIFRTYMQLYFLEKICGTESDMFNVWKKTTDGQEGGTEGDRLRPDDDEDRRSVKSDNGQDVGDQISVASADQRVCRQGSVRSTSGMSAASNGNGSRRIVNPNKQKDDHNPKPKNKKERMENDANTKLQQILEAAIGKFVAYDILKRIAKLFLEAQDTLASKKVDGLREKWLAHHQQKGQDGSKMDRDALVQSLRELYQCELDESDAECLFQQLDAEDSSGHVQYKDFENWMKKAHKRCTVLGNTLGGAQEAVGYLNKIMIGFLVAVSIVTWLFLTKIATTDLMVLLTSPLLAAAFIFGDTAKTVFQGIIFAFAVHPFDVGDTCVIEGNQLEVKKIGIWKTTFYKNGDEDEEVMYPNSNLINTSIVKHKFNLDYNDSIMFDVDFNLSDYATEDDAINKLKEKIDKYLDKHTDFVQGIHDVMVKEIGETVKIEVRVKHKKNVQHITYAECLQKKNESRSKLLQDIRTLIGEVQKEFKTKTSSE